MKKKFLIGAFILCSMTAVAEGEEFFFEEGVVTQRLDESVITTTGLDNSVRTTPKNVTVITRKEIEEKGSRSVADILNEVPGFKTTTMSGTDSKFDIRGQGTTAVSSVKVLLDGIPLNDIGMGAPNTSQIPVETIERIEVLPGGGSVLYGNGAIGGVVNIITTGAKNEPLYGYVGAEAGSNSYFKYTASAGSKVTDKLALQIDYTDKSTDGYRDNSNDDLEAFNFNAKYDISDTQNLVFKYSWAERDFEAPGSLDYNEKEDDRRQSTSLLDGKNTTNEFAVNYNNKINDNLELSLNTGYRDREYRSTTYNYKWNSISHMEYDNEQFFVNPQMKYSYLDNSYLITGLLYENSESDRLEGSYNAGLREKETLGAYAYNKYAWNQFEFIQGYRFERSQYDVDYLNNSSVEDLDETFRNDAFELAVNYLYSDTGNLFFGFNRAFRTPDTDELGFWDGDFKPQKSDTFELGVKDVVFGSYVSASIFRTITKDEIFYGRDSTGNSYNRNLDSKTERLGFELLAEQYFGKLTLKETFTYIDHEIRGGEYEGSELAGVSNLLYSVGATYNLTEKVTANLVTNYTGSYYANGDFDNEGGKEDGYYTANFHLKYTHAGITLYGGIDNLFNKEYDEYVGYSSGGGKYYYPSAERSFYGGFKYNF